MHLASDRELWDVEFADDIALNICYDPGALDCVRQALDRFCLASGASLNWHKSYGLLVGVENKVTWGLVDDFTWLAKGQTSRYLGFQVGIDVSSD